MTGDNGSVRRHNKDSPGVGSVGMFTLDFVDEDVLQLCVWEVNLEKVDSRADDSYPTETQGNFDR